MHFSDFQIAGHAHDGPAADEDIGLAVGKFQTAADLGGTSHMLALHEDVLLPCRYPSLQVEVIG